MHAGVVTVIHVAAGAHLWKGRCLYSVVGQRAFNIFYGWAFFYVYTCLSGLSAAALAHCLQSTTHILLPCHPALLSLPIPLPTRALPGVAKRDGGSRRVRIAACWRSPWSNLMLP